MLRNLPLPTGPAPARYRPRRRPSLAAARRLNELREAWLNPPKWVDWVITPEEEKAGFPKRDLAKPGHEADLKKRTLTNLYNARPTWLTLAHQQLDAAVAADYDWKDIDLIPPLRFQSMNWRRCPKAAG